MRYSFAGAGREASPSRSSSRVAAARRFASRASSDDASEKLASLMRRASRSGVADTDAAPERAGVAPAAMGLGVGASRRAGVIPEKSEPASETFSPPSSGV